MLQTCHIFSFHTRENSSSNGNLSGASHPSIKPTQSVKGLKSHAINKAVEGRRLHLIESDLPEERPWSSNSPQQQPCPIFYCNTCSRGSPHIPDHSTHCRSVLWWLFYRLSTGSAPEGLHCARLALPPAQSTQWFTGLLSPSSPHPQRGSLMRVRMQADESKISLSLKNRTSPDNFPTLEDG